MIYESEKMYIKSKKTATERIAAIDQIISVMQDAILDVSGDPHISEYQLNDGQTQIKAVYRDMASIVSGIYALERLKQMYVNQLSGRVIRLVNSRNFI